jgi:lysozyme family protein
LILPDASGASTTSRFFCLAFDTRQPSPAKMQLFAPSLGAESTGVLLIYLNAAPVQYAVGNAVLIILGLVIVTLTYAS